MKIKHIGNSSLKMADKQQKVNQIHKVYHPKNLKNECVERFF